MNERIHIDHLPNRTIAHNGTDYLFFSGTAYLGMPQHPGFQQLVAQSMSRYGTVFGSSRNGNLRLGVYEEAEAKLAARTGAGAALTLSSGMMAGQVIVNWLRREQTTFVYAPGAHPALWHAPVVELPKLSFPDWTAQLPTQLQALDAGPVAILMNSLEAVCSDYYDFAWINDLPDDRSITLVVDDSHGIGVLNNGRGIWPQLSSLQNRRSGPIRILVTASLAKAMGLPGGAVFSDAETIANLRETAFFGACSPMAPACLDAYLRADSLYAERQEQLQHNIRLAEERLLPSGLFRHAMGYPVFYTEHDELYAQLLDHKILIYSFAYPTAADRANTRIVISAFHEPDDIEQVARRLPQLFQAG
ncbi:aminotransferase class I/II-fold pyridoxal phosphate-dependent enzyme [Spirosoma sp.]|uniref:aminotransferase class I/II-fold pyridoxal phosphate-dependent enzyme n=1 Tax=Spirosoma sp. TaxID=1899569 RepID=UPI00260986F9|nr:aminotransferase class I/II-fold pyridoxal phosphate-dependent enzyme [Spirosoma sp.]MCX6219014.1 aminotransferase class I/II-fold pyridoxal phosphate-dependent enzyme [Spirosoma sp.]